MFIKDLDKNTYFIHEGEIYQKISNRNSGYSQNYTNKEKVVLDMNLDVEVLPTEELHMSIDEYVMPNESEIQIISDNSEKETELPEMKIELGEAKLAKKKKSPFKGTENASE